jgi:type I restriction enzyme S subunit
MNVPKLRFKDESGLDFPEWEEKTLGEIAHFSKGKGISKADIDEHGSTFCIRYGELYTEYGETIVNIKSKTNISTKNLVLSEVNDVIIPASGETQLDIAKASCVMVVGVALGSDLNIIKSKENGAFLSYYLNSQRNLEIARLAQGHSVVHLYASQLKLLNLNLPCLSEQTKIANFLSAVDDKIAELAKKVVLLQRYKKGAMQQIFSQQLRFKDDNGQDFPEWDIRDLETISCKVTLKNKDYSVSHVLTNSATQGIVSQSEYFDRDIANKVNLDGYYVVELDDFIYNPRISIHALVGPIKRNKLIKGVMSPLYTVFRFKEGSLSFFEQYFETTHWHEYMKNVSNTGVRHDRMNITNESFFSLPIPYPSLPEQTKIANFLSALDEQINTSQQQLELSKQYKQSLLQQMFI